MNKNHHHWFILVLGLVLMLAFFLMTQHRPYTQSIVMIASCFGYVTWGVWHHAKTKTLYKHVILEYLLVSVIVFSLAAGNSLLLQ